ncbi:MAG: hypothetical protein HY698_08880 [Deltaproteobacteria bacterium]|nr:hypothetical protein [Deltaproteobacteria bacterium]
MENVNGRKRVAGKLVLGKETLRRLSERDLENAGGGIVASDPACSWRYCGTARCTNSCISCRSDCAESFKSDDCILEPNW